MDQTLVQVGLPVKCAYGDCEAKSFVKPQSDYGGWYKSRFFQRRPGKRWFCPTHYVAGHEIDDSFFHKTAAADRQPIQAEATMDELYKALEETEDNDN